MFDFIEKIRSKSEKQKKLIAFSCALFFASTILALWLLVWLPEFQFKQNQEAKAVLKEPSPLSTFTDAIGDGFSELGGQMNKLKESANVFHSGVEYYSATSTEANQ